MELLTTHSPYLLGTVNSLLLAGQVPKKNVALMEERLNKQFWLNYRQTAAYHVHDGKAEKALVKEEGLTLIDNALIDGASDEINELTDFVLDLMPPQNEEGQLAAD